MSSRLRYLCLAAPLLLGLSQCNTNIFESPEEEDPNHYGPTYVNCDVIHDQVANVHSNTKIEGTIVDVYNVYQDVAGINNSNTRVENQSRLQVDLKLACDGNGATFKGTGHVTWERHNKLVYRQNPGVCADGQLIDSNVREWTVDLTGKFYCADDGKLGIEASGSPDGSNIPTTLHYHDYGCHTGCAPCYDQTGPTSELIKWSSFVEVGIDKNSFKRRVDMTPPAPFSGEWYREITLSVFEEGL